MGYIIGIGEKEIIIEDEKEKVYAKEFEIEEAPEFEGDEVTGQTNQRNPSYSGFSDFVKEAELQVFASKIIQKHPGFVKVEKWQLDEIKKAKEKRLEKYPNVEPGFEDDMDDVLARLIWFEFWLKWALKNCKDPIIANS